ncbi:MAG: hypothetical protein CL596_10545 [Alteromonas sp.]|nr:hypothetical protein [Alteromonas sp.]MAY22376.1 hypothetical protein [Flavobacteriaceae bacterium]|tara:strand:- start:63168 stop:64460 length:1293 start_codon:yes stop_codon:yes gene_type:complete
MLLIYTQKLTPRVDYVFKHICTRILGLKIEFTSAIEEFISYPGVKLSYGKQPLGNELFFYSQGLLQTQGFEDVSISVKPWEETVGFFSASEKSALPFDIFAASFYLLSRYEEFQPHVKDALGRFPAQESLAYKEGFLEQPVIDLWAFKFKAVLSENFSEMEFPKRSFQIHNIVEAKRPYEFLQRGFLRSFLGFGGDFWKLRLRRVFLRTRVLLHLRKDPYDTFNWILNNDKNSRAKLTVFFLLGEGYTFREDFNTKKEKFKNLIKYVGDYSEIGLAFSYHALHDYEKLKLQKKQLEEITHRPLQSSFNDKQLINLPTIYRDLVELEIERDFTMFYYNEIGFRAGTCTPFLFYDLDYEVKTPLTIHPVVGKSLALTLGNENDLEGRIMKVFHWVEKVQGTFSFFFSNRDFSQSKENKTWRYLFSEKLNPHA